MTDKQTRRTEQEIAALKDEWLSDPCWDIENTEGFELHHDELKRWSLEKKAEESRWWYEQVATKAAKLGCSYALAEYIYQLEHNLKVLEKRLEKLEADS